MPATNRKRRLNLFNKDPHCHWCKVLTVFPPPGQPTHPVPDNLATLDHLHSRFSGNKNLGGGPVGIMTVLACHKCNQERALKEKEALGEEACEAHSEMVWNSRCFYQALGRILVGEQNVYI